MWDILPHKKILVPVRQVRRRPIANAIDIKVFEYSSVDFSSFILFEFYSMTLLAIFSQMSRVMTLKKRGWVVQWSSIGACEPSDGGSSPPSSSNKWARSSIGRALGLQLRLCGFKSHRSPL